MEQCDAAEGTRLRYGLEAAFADVVGEKLLHFDEAVASKSNFARELLRFLSRVQNIFTTDGLRTNLASIDPLRRETALTNEELAAINSE